MPPAITVHVLPPSHPCLTAEAALRLKGLEYVRVVLESGRHGEAMEAIDGAGRTTVPGIVVDGEPVHGSLAITARLEELVPEPALFPAGQAEAVRAAETWGDSEAAGPGAPPAVVRDALPPRGDGHLRRRRSARPAWHRLRDRIRPRRLEVPRHHAVRVAEDLAGLPAKLDHVDALIADGTLGGGQANAADLQIGATLRVLLCVGDLHALMLGRPLERLARRWFPAYPGLVPAGAFPASWLG